MNGCSFDDRWTNIQEYTNWLRPRLQEFERILKPTGSIYLHCDWHVSHYIKVLSDGIFGINNFINEIVWKRQSAHNDAKQGSKHFGRIHDTILLYAGSQNYVWNQQYVPFSEPYIRRTYKFVEKKTERKYAVGDLTGPGGASKGNPRYEFLGMTRYWRYSETKMQELLLSSKIVHAIGRVPGLKRYLDEMQGKPVQDIWCDINLDRSKGKFPTQKPGALLERIVNTSSNPGQIVYEPFAGSSTAGCLCYKLSRRWVGSETSECACLHSVKRLKELGCNVQLFPSIKTKPTNSPGVCSIDNDRY